MWCLGSLQGVLIRGALVIRGGSGGVAMMNVVPRSDSMTLFPPTEQLAPWSTPVEVTVLSTTLLSLS